MIKILFFIETLEGGGAEKVLRNLVNHMDQTRFEITVQTVWPCDSAKYLAPGIHCRSMYSKKNCVNKLRYRVEAESGLAYRMHIKDDYDIECAYLEMGTTKLMAASNNYKAKKLAWVHCDLKMAVKNQKAFVQKAAKWYQKFDKVICVSENVKESFEDLFGVNPPATVLYNVIDEKEILEKSLDNCPITKKRLTGITIGRITAQKGFDRLLRVYRQLKVKGYEFDLWILGEGPDRTVLEHWTREQGLSDSVKFLGFCENPYPFIRSADFYVCSSRYEGMSTSIIEALLLDKAIITTDCTGMREMLGDSEFGLIVSNDETGLLDGLRQFVSDEQIRSHYRDMASIWNSRFSARKASENTQRYFEAL